MKKRVLALILALAMLIAVLPVSAMAADEELPAQTDAALSGETAVPAAAEMPAAEETAPVPAETEMAADQAEEPGIHTFSLTYVNPLYPDAELAQPKTVRKSAAKSAAAASSDYLTVEQAGAALREAMKNRETGPVIYVESGSDFSTVAGEMLETAMAHTGVPTEGDYIRWQFAGYNVSGSYYSNGSTNCYTMRYTVTYYTDAAQEAEMDAKVAGILDSLNVYASSAYDKIRAVYGYLTENVVYDYANLSDTAYKLKYTGYAALMNGTSVCQGYAVAFYRLALELGVDARVVTGDAGGAHAWNIARAAGRYYYLDATWDAGSRNYCWFMIGGLSLGSHVPENEWLSEYDISAVDYGSGGTAELSITSIELLDVPTEMIRDFGMSTIREQDPETGEWGIPWTRYRCAPTRIGVTANGAYFAGSPDEVAEALEREFGRPVMWFVDDGQTAAVRWDVGEHTVRFVFGGAEVSYTVTVVPTPVTSVTLNKSVFTVAEHTRGGWRDYYDEAIGETVRDAWYEYSVYPDEITVVMNGETYTGDYWDINERLAVLTGRPYAAVPSGEEQSYEHPWGIGDHEAALNVLGFIVPYTVRVANTPVTDVAVGPVSLVEGMDVWEYEDYQWNGTTGEWEVYYYDRYSYDIGRLTVVADGVTYSGDLWEVEEALRAVYGSAFSVSVTDDQGYRNPWGVGSHSATINVMGFEAEVTVVIVASPVTSVKIGCDSFTVIEHTRGEWVSDYDPVTGEEIPGVWYRYDVCPERITVTANGVEYSGNIYEVAQQVGEALGMHVRYSYADGQEPGRVWGVGSHETALKFMGFKVPYTVCIIKSPVTSVEALGFARGEKIDGYWDGYWDQSRGEWVENAWFRYYEYPEQVTVVADGVIYSGWTATVLMDLEEKYGMTAYVAYGSDQSYGNQWGLGEHEAWVEIMGVRGYFPLTVIKSMPVPQNVTAENKVSGVLLSWDAVPGAVGYQIARMDDEGMYQYFYADAKTSLTDIGVQSGRMYLYSVSALGSGGDGTYSGAYSEYVPVLYLAMPANVKAVNETGGVRVSWDAVEGATGYTVYRRSEGSSKWSAQYTTSSAKTVSYLNKNAKDLTGTFYYTVRANYNDEDGFEFHSSRAVTGTKLVRIGIQELQAPVITSIANGFSSILVKWSRVEGADGYYVYRRAEGASSWTKLKTVSQPDNGDTVSFGNTAATDGKVYAYKVVAFRGSGTAQECSPDSNVKSYMRLKNPTLTAVAKGSGKIGFSWTQKTGVSGYQIEYTAGTSFTGAVRKTLNGETKLSTVYSGFTPGTEYRVRVRAFVKYWNEAEGKEMYYYGTWSSADTAGSVQWVTAK